MPVALLLCAAFAQDSIIGGTQPHELAIPLDDPESCVVCHAGFAGSPWDAWAGTMMANAMRDPMFLAALTIAEQDIPDIGDFCLRCHTPNGWLEGRCLPGDGSNLIESDYEGVSCDICHRMTGPTLAGNARYVVSPSPDKRGAIGSDLASHGTVVDPVTSSSELCGTCHEVSNPLFGDFPIERTYSEYLASAFPAEGKTCQSCHMKVVTGVAATEPGLPTRDVHVHRFVGGNTWMPKVLAAMYPDLGRDEAFRQASEDAEELLRSEVEVEVVVPVTAATAGQPNTFQVKVTNGSGHKFPTGYPEGRRAWLEVVVTDATGRELLRSGTYDAATADLPEDPQIRIYQALLGTNGVQTYHMVEQNEIIFDGRIPPRGFRSSPDMAPVGRTFEPQPDGSLANWDLAPYTFDVPADAASPLTVDATLWYQTTTKKFMEFLRDENVTDDRGDVMYALWEEHGKSPPVELVSATGTLNVVQPLVLDEDDEDEGGCGCHTGGGGAGLALAALLAAARRRRRGS